MKQTESPWTYKPWWCQPWSILFTGTTIIASSWAMFNNIWFSVVVAVPILSWMGFFLLLWPRLMAQAISEHQQSGGSYQD